MRHRRGSGIPPPAWRAYLGLALLAVLGVAPAGAAEPVVRRIHEPEALAAFPVWAIAQDAQGFLWLGTQGRLYRWDGLVLQRHAAASLPDTPWELRVSPDGVLHLRTRERGDLLRLAVGEVEPVTGPRGAPLTGLTAFAWDSGGALWVTGRGGLWRYGTNESWREVIDPRISGGRARRLRPAADNAMLVATRTEVYRVATGGDVRQLAKLPSDVHGGLVDLLELPDGRLALLPFWGGIYLAEGGEVRHVVVRRDRGIALVLRGDTLWASFAASVVGLRPDGSVEIVGEDEGVTSGGPMLLDREGSLWVGSFNGLTQLPEPDTVIWKRGDGLPTAAPPSSGGGGARRSSRRRTLSPAEEARVVGTPPRQWQAPLAGWRGRSDLQRFQLRRPGRGRGRLELRDSSRRRPHRRPRGARRRDAVGGQ